MNELYCVWFCVEFGCLCKEFCLLVDVWVMLGGFVVFFWVGEVLVLVLLIESLDVVVFVFLVDGEVWFMLVFVLVFGVS